MLAGRNQPFCLGTTACFAVRKRRMQGRAYDSSEVKTMPGSDLGRAERQDGYRVTVDVICTVPKALAFPLRPTLGAGTMSRRTWRKVWE